jgi:hypothetical protein
MMHFAFFFPSFASSKGVGEERPEGKLILQLAVNSLEALFWVLTAALFASYLKKIEWY